MVPNLHIETVLQLHRDRNQIIVDRNATDVGEKIKERLFVAICRWLVLCLPIVGFSVFKPGGAFDIRFADRYHDLKYRAVRIGWKNRQASVGLDHRAANRQTQPNTI